MMKALLWVEDGTLLEMEVNASYSFASGKGPVTKLGDKVTVGIFHGNTPPILAFHRCRKILLFLESLVRRVANGKGFEFKISVVSPDCISDITPPDRYVDATTLLDYSRAFDKLEEDGITVNRVKMALVEKKPADEKGG